jgi:hypothetical protein
MHVTFAKWTLQRHRSSFRPLRELALSIFIPWNHDRPFDPYLPVLFIFFLFLFLFLSSIPLHTTWAYLYRTFIRLRPWALDCVLDQILISAMR